MLRHNNMIDTLSVHSSFSPFSSTTPLQLPSEVAPNHITTDTPITSTENSDLLIAQLNCFNGKIITLSLLANEQYSILLLQEPWIDPHTLRLPPHPAWHDFTPYDYTATNYNDRPRTGIYVTKQIPSCWITLLPSKSALLTAIEVKVSNGRLQRLRTVSAYNPPTYNTGLPVLHDWLGTHNNRRIPSIIGMDGNLHHAKWNPPNYRHVHPLAKELIRTCGSAGFQVISQSQVPTFYPRRPNARPTTIDLTWINHALTKLKVEGLTCHENYGSDHQLLLTTIRLEDPMPEKTHNTARFETMGKASFCNNLENQLSNFPSSIKSPTEIDQGVQLLTGAVMTAFHKQGKTVKTNRHRHKAWWDEELLGPLMKERNRARKWMILSKSSSAKQCYWSWNDYVKRTIHDLKKKHWRLFLAKANNAMTFKAFKYTTTQTTNSVAPLYRPDRSLATEKQEQAELLFKGTSIVQNICDTADIPATSTRAQEHEYPAITDYEIEEILKKIPSKRATGADGIPNELLKLATSILLPHLTTLFNACLKLGIFPQAWRTATTAILRKNDKDDYSEAGAYRPIALLSCLGKVLETVITRRIAYWAETHKAIAPGHMGGRRQHSTDDAFIILTSWIHQKWREGKIVSGLFLDVKSAYPSVHKRRLLHTLKSKNCPAYIVQQIDSFLEDRTTTLRLQDFLSEGFNVDDGLPQGSPLSVILYILYNSSLLIDANISLQADRISLAFIDDVTHLVANRDIDHNVLDLEEEGDRSLGWGKSHGAIFDQKKAQLMHFTHKRHSNPPIMFGDQKLTPMTVELRWLGLWLDPKLTFGAHIKRMHQRGKATIAQLSRISRCYHGLNSRETRNLVSAVLKPRILFGSVVWFNTRTEGKVSKILELLQNAANRLILGAFKSSPTSFLTHDANTIKLKDLAIRYHHNYIYKRLTTPSYHPSRTILQQELLRTPSSHQSPIHRLLRKTDLLLPQDHLLETIYPYPEPPWAAPRWVVGNVGCTRDEVKDRIQAQIDEEKEGGACVMFTDGSFIPDKGAGAAVATTERVASHAYGPLTGISNYEMETMALMIALVQFKLITDESPNRFSALAIFSDSQAALDLMAKPLQPKSLQYLTRFLLRSYQKIPHNLPIRLYWTPGHEGIELNEQADKAAKQAAEDYSDPLILPMSLGGLLRHTKNLYTTRGAVLTRPYKTKAKLIADALTSLEKGGAAAIFQLRCGHCPLKKFLHRIGAEDDEICEGCRAKETPAHFLIYCRKYSKQRQAFRRSLREEEIRVDVNSATAILDNPKVYPFLARFIQDTGRFTHLHSYLDT